MNNLILIDKNRIIPTLHYMSQAIQSVEEDFDYFNNIFTAMQTPGEEIDIDPLYLLPSRSYTSHITLPHIICTLNKIFIKSRQSTELSDQFDKFFDSSNENNFEFFKSLINESLNGTLFNQQGINTHLRCIGQDFYVYLKKHKVLTSTNLKKLRNYFFPEQAKVDSVQVVKELIGKMALEVKNSFEFSIAAKKLIKILRDKKIFKKVINRFSAKNLIILSMLIPFTDKLDAVILYEEIYKKGFTTETIYSDPVVTNMRYTVYETVNFLMRFDSGSVLPVMRNPEDIFQSMESALKAEPRKLMAMFGTFLVYGKLGQDVKFPEYTATMKNYLLTRLHDEAVTYFMRDRGLEDELQKYLFNKDENELLSKVEKHMIPGFLSIKHFK